MATATKRISLAITAAAGAAPPSKLRPVRLPLIRRLARTDALLIASGGDVLSVDLESGATAVVASGFANPVGIAPDASGRIVYVADQVGRRYVISAVAAGGLGRRRVVANGVGRIGQLALHDTTLAFVEDATGEVRTIDVTTGSTETIGAGLLPTGGIAFSDDGAQLHVVEAESGRWLSIAPGDAGFTEIADGLTGAGHLTRGARTGTLLVPGTREDVDGTHGIVSTLALSRGRAKEVYDLGVSEQPFAVWQLASERLIAVDRFGITWWDVRPPVVSRPVTLTIGNDKPFIGSYERVVVDMGTTGFVIEDFDFTLPDGDAGGRISLSHDDLSVAGEIMLLVGYQPGDHKLVAFHRPTSTEVAVLEFHITDEWADPSASPAHWLAGPVGTFQTGYTWGGGGTTPQNVDVIPQSGTRNIAILMVDVSDARYPAGAGFDTIRNDWSDSAVGGVDSARLYFEEVSYGGFTLALAGGTPPLVNIGGNWASQFATMPSPWPSNSFAPSNAQAFAQACVSNAAAQVDGGGNPLLDFSTVRSLILVVRSAGPAGSDDFFWPQAWGGNFTIPGGSVNLNVLGMPDDWQGTRDSRTRTETLAHELGHNLGYPDLYTNVSSWNYSADIQSRDVTNLDLMSTEQQLPAMTIAQRMETGWVRPEWVRTFDFSRSTIPLDQTVTLHAIEDGAPPAGQLTGVEIRIADGWNYYFEYRRAQAGDISDQQLGSDASTGNGVIVGTDVGSQSFTFPINRPQIIRLRPDVDGENSFFFPGNDYEETDTSSMAVADFRMTVVSAAGNTAQVRIEYGTNGRPDLVIRPWPGGDNWQSPDIEVRNARSLADPAWRNVPWEGHANDVVATYRNRGPVTARNVTVDFYIKDFTVGGAPEVWLGRDTKDVPPDTTTPTVEFTTQWLPGSQGHRCIIARTPLYLDTSVTPTIVEVSDANNMAQTNYSRYISAAASPANRVRSTVALHNPFPERALMYVMPQLTGPMAQYYRVYLAHQSVMLDPGETRRVEVMVESLFGDPRMKELQRIMEKLVRTPANLSLIGFGIPPEAPNHPVILGGVQVRTDTGWATKFEFVEVADKRAVRGRVVTVGTGQGVTGQVLITFHGPDETFDNTVSVPLKGGSFVLETAPYIEKFRAEELSLHYPGNPPYTACDPEKDRYPVG
ncbi:hypothetical protein [Microbacterium sp. SS28]|uniref:hypothetical protein n=1 Tax=Microbacterium sp. SS28 TaxID=2919948 RepID=UPI001FA9E840|nr:hypothetical protein [Microbacterium sp. SS28]